MGLELGGWNGEAGVLRTEGFEAGARGLRVLLERKSVAKRLILLASCSDSSIQRVYPEIFQHIFVIHSSHTSPTTSSSPCGVHVSSPSPRFFFTNPNTELRPPIPTMLTNPTLSQIITRRHPFPMAPALSTTTSSSRGMARGTYPS